MASPLGNLIAIGIFGTGILLQLFLLLQKKRVNLRHLFVYTGISLFVFLPGDGEYKPLEHAFIFFILFTAFFVIDNRNNIAPFVNEQVMLSLMITFWYLVSNFSFQSEPIEFINALFTVCGMAIGFILILIFVVTILLESFRLVFRPQKITPLILRYSAIIIVCSAVVLCIAYAGLVEPFKGVINFYNSFLVVAFFFTMLVIKEAFSPDHTHNRTKFLLYFWYLIVIVFLGFMQVVHLVSLDIRVFHPIIRIIIVFLFGMASAYLFTHSLFIFELIPLVGKRESVRHRIQRLQESIVFYTARYSDGQMHPFQLFFIIFIQGGSYALNSVVHFVSPYLLINFWVALLPLILYVYYKISHRFNAH